MRIIFLLLLISCVTSRENEEILTPPQMVEVMINIHLLEVKVLKFKVEPPDTLQAVYTHFEEQLFEKLAITRKRYEQSFDYYLRRPPEFEKIYAIVVDSLMKYENLSLGNGFSKKN